MISSDISMPHPVLGIQNDFKEGHFNLNFKIRIDRTSRQYILTEIQPEITNNYIDGLPKKLIIKVSCSPTYKTWTFIDSNEIRLPEDEVDAVLEIEGFLISSASIQEYYDASFNTEIFGTKSFELEPGDIIGLTGTKRVLIEKEHEKVSIGSIFRFSKIKPDEEDQEISFSFDDDQIVIYYPVSRSEYDPVTLLFDRSQGMPYTALNLYILPALTEAFREIEESGIEITKKWKLVIDELLPENDRTGDYYTDAQKIFRVDVPINLAYKEILKVKNFITE